MNSGYTMFDYDELSEADLWDLSDYYYSITQ